VRSGVDGSLVRKMDPGNTYDLLVMGEDVRKKPELQFCALRETSFFCADEKGATRFVGEAPLNELKSAGPPPEPQPAATPIYHEDGTAEAPGDTSTSYEPTESIFQPRAVWVALVKDKPKYLAVVGAYIGIPRANFYVYEPDGKLIYHELLPENAETIAVIAGENGVEQLLVGGKDTIWKYGR
jgi:hypothetical protein